MGRRGLVMLMFVKKVRRGGEGWRYPLPHAEAASLVRWRDGRGTEEDSERLQAMLERARIQKVWLGCGCCATGDGMPLLAVVRSKDGGRYHLRRMLAPGRPRHSETCAWSDLTLEVRKGRGPRGRGGGEEGDREPRVAPRLAGVLTALLAQSGVLVRSAEDQRSSIGSEFAAIRMIGRRFELIPGEPLGDLFADHIGALRSGEFLTAIAAAEERSGRPASALACLYARQVEDRRLGLAEGSELELREPVGWIEGGPGAGGPFLVLVRCEGGNDGVVAEEAVATPVLSGRRFIPVTSDLERRGMDWLLRLQWSLQRAGLGVRLERPVHATAAAAGECRPSALLRVPTKSGEGTIAIRIGVGPVGWEEDRARMEAIGHPFRLGLRDLEDAGAKHRLRRLCFAIHRSHAVAGRE
jgi:hypothetical protein